MAAAKKNVSAARHMNDIVTIALVAPKIINSAAEMLFTFYATIIVIAVHHMTLL
jgi:hypothetical protein